MTEKELLDALINNLHSSAFYYGIVNEWFENKKALKWWQFYEKWKLDHILLKELKLAMKAIMFRNYDINGIETPIIKINNNERDN